LAGFKNKEGRENAVGMADIKCKIQKKFDTLRGRGDGVFVSLSTGFTRGSATADAVLKSLTPDGVVSLTLWKGTNQDHGVVELLNSPRCNLGKNVNDSEDDNPEALVPMSAAISGGLNFLEMELQIPKDMKA
jgi:hypothetical protein